MMRLVGLMLCAAGPAAAVELPVRLADGATWTMTVEHTRETDRAGKRQTMAVTTTSRLVWRDGELTSHPVSTVVSPGGLPGPSLGVPIVLAVDEALTPTEIRNLPQVRAAMEALIDRTAPGSKAPGGLREALPGLLDASVTAMAMGDLTRAALGQGTSLELGKDTPYEDSLPNPLGGPPIATKASFRLDAYDRTTGRAVVSWRQTFDPQSAQASLQVALNALTAKVAPDKADEARAAYATMKMEREDSCRHEIDIPTGLAVKAVCTTETVMGVTGQSGSNSDRWTITQTLPQTEAAR